jgi:cytochrome c oxidase subunit II
MWFQYKFTGSLDSTMDRTQTAVFAIIGAAVIMTLYLNYNGAFTPSGAVENNGQLIYTNGADYTGTRVQFNGGPAWMSMMGGACVSCHGADGRGGYYPMMCDTKSADVRYTSLLFAGFTDSTIRRAITSGFDEKGDNLSTCMPRWTMTDRNLADTVDYLKQLG